MKPFQERVKQERTDLAGSLKRLEAFARGEQWTDLNPNERHDLISQGDVMASYLRILDRRIEGFETGLPSTNPPASMDRSV